jgi:hypothetical protein
VKTAAIVGWSGYGELSNLEQTVLSKLSLAAGAVVTGSMSLTVPKADPVAVARRLAYLPGVDWVAVGYEFEGQGGLASKLQLLAKRYLHRDSTFKLTAQVEKGDQEEGDILLDGNGTILKSATGTRVDEKNPDVTFRILQARGRGAVGVQLKEGPRGVPTSRSLRAVCLVSGGYHSAVTAWMAALSGYSVTLLHARADDESLRQVARLYAELSKRVDAASLKLEVLDGAGKPGERLSAWLDSAKGDILAGAHPECRGNSAREVFKRFPSVIAPLLLLQEDEVRRRLDSLGIKVKTIDSSPTLTLAGRKSPYVNRRFGGVEADINGVMDRILS